ncbi:DUF5615 family PIN-like protein [Halalkalirubrum salinum]|uniref:DUF5615 family PIN-like protein n=1 Tax=Halalkalirubrum salinum TaxID=2563889 RepID=UPI0010FAD7A5|nr:DUF5615 family PIN-like protein [Halalkalirubrum salinum]
MRFLTDEHVPNVFITTLRSSGFEVLKANDLFGEATNDRQLLEYCADQGYLLVTHDKKDFAGTVGDDVDHNGIVIYTDPIFLRDQPEAAVRIIERVLDHYPPEELHGEHIWLDQWR